MLNKRRTSRRRKKYNRGGLGEKEKIKEKEEPGKEMEEGQSKSKKKKKKKKKSRDRKRRTEEKSLKQTNACKRGITLNMYHYNNK